MFQPLYVAATGLNTFEDEITDITNNLANSKTVGFKKGRTEKESLFVMEKNFSSHLNEAIRRQQEEGVGTSAVEFGTGVRVVSTPKDFTQGTIETTNNPTDIAISGEGFFQISMPDGKIAYSRAGGFHVDSDGNFVDPNGHLLDPPVILPQNTTSILIKENGMVFVSINNSIDLTEVGQINLAKFTSPAGLKSLGQNLYEETTASGSPMIGLPTQEGYGSLQQSALEQSNVDVISEMMRMIMVQRVFDTVTKAVQTYDAMLTSVERMKA
ncbi:MAG: flagellar basal-body rod protein FlgG [Candidatus Saganbacteria bacterium]|nr:flagellar basal-body rod protein FlgG [Candidatus Saganbacteria bacterium]